MCRARRLFLTAESWYPCGMTHASQFTLPALQTHADWRDVADGLPICEHGCCDQPHASTLADGAWLGVLTTSGEREGVA